jgi:hypothetical protein
LKISNINISNKPCQWCLSFGANGTALKRIRIKDVCYPAVKLIVVIAASVV